MYEWKDYSNLRPLGNRVLVKRLALPEIRESGLFIIGRDYPTMGKVLAVGNGPRRRKDEIFGQELGRGLGGFWPAGSRRGIDIKPNDLVQWSIDSNFDLKQIGKTADGLDLFLFDYGDLNFVGGEE